mmetsp:Transcript_17237/g.35509  ORF Transcript_17237/g.35509 Transcript_17237/m.35509 type:complete len:94 (+) Transcript_17237:253-534(+)
MITFLQRMYKAMNSVKISSARKNSSSKICSESDFPFRLDMYIESKPIAKVLSTMNVSSLLMLKAKTSSYETQVTLEKIWATNRTNTNTRPCIV